MSKQAKRRILSLLGACAVGFAAVLATFAAATASARSQTLDGTKAAAGFERQGRIWVKTATAATGKPAERGSTGGARSGFRKQGRLWIKDSLRALVGGQGPSLAFTKTVGTDALVCASTDTIGVPSGVPVFYCFYMTNTGAVTLVTHTVVDDQLGTVLGPDFPAPVVPGGSAWFTVGTTMGTMDILNTATWTALDGAGAPAADTDTALVTILQPSIAFTKTVGEDPTLCAATDTIAVVAGSTVYYCFYMHNDGDVTLTLHDVVDDQLGTVLGPGFPASVTPGGSAWFTVGTTMGTTDILNTATWTAYNPGPVDLVAATDTAEVTIVVPVELTGFEVD
jgi:hypothetical protein